MSERYVQKMHVKNCGNFDDPACMHFIDSTEKDEEQVTVQNIKFGGHL
jgi:predicted metal-binding protein